MWLFLGASMSFLNLDYAAATMNCSISSTQYNALEEFYSNLGGLYWNYDAKYPNTSEWSFPSDVLAPCSKAWQGVSCKLEATSLNICNIVGLTLTAMNLVGRLPDSIGDLTSLQTLALEGNSISGSLPQTLATLYNLTAFDVGSNVITGSFPTFMGDISGLVLFAINNNLIHGTLASQLANSRSLEMLYVNGNNLSGPIPIWLGDLKNLSYFAANNNVLTGKVPMELTLLPLLIYVQVSSNLLSGREPLELGLGPFVSYVVGQANYFSGSLPSNWSGFDRLGYVLLDENFISGSIPFSIGLGNVSSMSAGARISLVEFSLSYNLLTSSIPYTLGSHTAMIALSLASNSLSGYLPSQLSQLQLLSILNISSNALSGTLISTLTQVLSVVSLADNSFTGSIPPSLFVSPNLTIMDLSTNCFSGSLPGTLCSAPSSLTTLVLNALASGKKCRASIPKILSGIFHGTLSTKRLSATFPSCIFSLAGLQTLELAGNGMLGSLPNQPLPASLSTLVLSSNLLEGEIPLYIQLKGNFTKLALQHNRLWGTLANEFDVTSKNSTTFASVRLRVNRLSGPVPSTFRNLPVINVLEGNLFSCVNTNELPVNDPEVATYSCGSNNFNTSLIIWVAAAGVATISFIAGFILLYFLTSSTEKRLREESVRQSTCWKLRNTIVRIYFNTLQWYYFQYPSGRVTFANTFQFLAMLKSSGSGMAMLSLFYVVVCMNTYILLKSFSSVASVTHYQYSWILTTAYMHGSTPVVLIMLYMTLSVILIAIRIRDRVEIEEVKSGRFCPQSNLLSAWKLSSLSSWDTYAKVGNNVVVPFLCHCFNAGIALYVNAVYVRIFEFEKITPLQQFGVEVMLSTFKVVWTALFVPYSMRYFRQFSASHRLCHQVFMMCVVMILAPILVSVAGSLSCFYNVFVPTTSIVSTYSAPSLSVECSPEVIDEFVDGQQIVGISSVCDTTVSDIGVTTTATSQFVYSYECGSTIITSYIPVFMYSYIYSCLLLPVARMVLLHCSQATLSRYLPKSVYNNFIVNTLFDCNDMIENSAVVSRMTATDATSAIARQLTASQKAVVQAEPSQKTTVESESQAISSGKERADSLNGSSKSIVLATSFSTRISLFLNNISLYSEESIASTGLFDGSNVVAKRLLDFGVMLTFGLACPPLGLAVAFSAFVNAGVWRIMIGKYLASHVTRLPENSAGAFRKVEISSNGLLLGSTVALWVVCYVGCIFWSFMLFDMVADVYGDSSGFAVVFVLLFVSPVFMFLVLRVYDFSKSSRRKMLFRKQNSEKSPLAPSDIQLNGDFQSQL
jgi:hypothetical protein